MAYLSAVPKRRGHQRCTLCRDLTQPPQKALMTKTDQKAVPSMMAKTDAGQKTFVLLSNLSVRKSLEI